MFCRQPRDFNNFFSYDCALPSLGHTLFFIPILFTLIDATSLSIFSTCPSLCIYKALSVSVCERYEILCKGQASVTTTTRQTGDEYE